MPMRSLLSKGQKKTFHDDGVVLLKGILGPADIAKLKTALRAQAAEAFLSPTALDFEKIASEIWDDELPPQRTAQRFDVAALCAVIKSDPKARPLRDTVANSDKGSFLFEASGWRRHREIREVAFDSVLPVLASELLNSSVVSFWDDTTFIKGPYTQQKTAFHQDLGYNNYAGEDAVVFWAPLDAAKEESGVTKYVRGSHKSGVVYAPNLFLSQTPMPGADGPTCPDIEANEEDFDIVCFDVEPGDIIVHHIKTIHGAGGNRTNQLRRAISFHYCGGDARYQSRLGAAPRLSDIDELSDGDAICSRDHPVVWPRPWPQIKLSELLPDSATDGAGNKSDRNAVPAAPNHC